MNQHIEEYLDAPSEERFHALLGDEEDVIVWIDHRDDEESIVSAIESCLKTDKLTSKVVDSDNEHGFDFIIKYKGAKKRVPFVTLGTHNRQEAIVTLNELLSPDYEVRFCVDSSGSDTLAYIPLSCNDWNKLENQYGVIAVRRRFYPINKESPNMFTDPIYPPTFENGKMLVHGTSESSGIFAFIRSFFGR